MTNQNSSAVHPSYGIKPLGKLFRWLRIFFFAYIVGEALMAIGVALQLLSGSIMFGLEYEFSLGDGLSALGSLVFLIGLLVSIVLFCVFSVRSMRNLHAWNVPDAMSKPGWAAGWYFIPIANLWKPLGVMREIVNGTDSLGGRSSDAPLGLWWCFWIVMNIVSNISFRLSLNAGAFEEYATDVPLYKTTLMLDIVSSLSGVAAALIILGVLRNIANLQDAYIQARRY